MSCCWLPAAQHSQLGYLNAAHLALGWIYQWHNLLLQNLCAQMFLPFNNTWNALWEIIWYEKINLVMEGTKKIWVDNEQLVSKLYLFENFINYIWFKSNLHYEKLSFLGYAGQNFACLDRIFPGRIYWWLCALNCRNWESTTRNVWWVEIRKLKPQSCADKEPGTLKWWYFKSQCQTV